MKKTTLLIFLFLFAIKGNAQCWKSISASPKNTIAIKMDGTLWAWGDSVLTGSGTGSKSTPYQIGTATNWQTVSAGNSHALAIKTDGTLWAWGFNLSGEFGNGASNTFSILPIQIGTETNWSKIATAYQSSKAIKTDGTLWAWGYNGGQFGDGTTVNKLIPTQIGIDTNWSSISFKNYNLTYDFTLALKTDGTLWAWGKNNDGQLGDGTIINKYVPMQIGTDANWFSINTGGTHSLAIKTNGTLWAWGSNNYGELGDGTTVSKLIPTQIDISTRWTSIYAGNGFSVATKTGGALLAWGVNTSGQLGDGTYTSQSLPIVLLTTAAAVQTVAVSYSHTLIEGDTGAFSWGVNTIGQLGDGTTVNKNIPTAIACPTSVLKNESFMVENGFSIFPNPNHGSFFIKANNGSEPIEGIKIYSLQGKLLFTKKITSTNEEIKTTGISSGVYLLNIESKNGVSSNQKIAIQ
ncbi:MAG: T9SS type A sorting domain-containing protein [Lentimicrobium sp.]|nr:T9SS type A sorting domain-containing protein [Lentimicrobium sp.]